MSLKIPKNKFDKNFWKTKYNNDDTGWNIGYTSMSIKTYIYQLTDKALKIVIPGAYNSYDDEYLHFNGLRIVYVLYNSSDTLQN